jgi:aminobenzoyl-glutamate utilization protein B
MEFEQGTNYSNVLPNDALTEVLGRAMQKAGGYEYTPGEKTFATELQKTLGGPVRSPGPEKVRTDMSEGTGSASSDSGDVSWVVPTAQFTAATFVPGVSAHTWQAAACAGTSIGRKGMVVAARTLAVAGVELFENPSKVKAAHDAFEKRLDGRKWSTRIAPDSKPPMDYATK